ncbi:MAG: beta-ketoacyl-ACP synthase II [Lachnospiraceae bacterium]|nr:beta-ketoacyl-ACP synthase II [Lachnospiraceae bacterium]
MRRVVITGLGAITPLGNTAQETWDSIQQGKCGIAPITLYDTTGRKVILAAEVKNFVPEDHLDKREARTMDRFSQFALIAAREAFADSGLDMEAEDSTRCGVIISSGIGGLATIEGEDGKGREKGYDRVSPYFIPMVITNMAAGNVAIALGFQGMCSCVVTACAGGTNAIGDAFHRIRYGMEDVILCGGSEAAITPLGMGGFTSMKALHMGTDPNRASIPFDQERSGFVMGEGAGMLMMEEYEHALKRGAKIYCEVVGYGANCDANHMTAPLEDGSGAARCMQLAIKEAEIAPDAIDYINAHGTSTPLNDKGETKAVKLALGEAAKKVMISSTKSMTGHLLGASGAIEGIITALSVKNDYVPATINYREADADCDLDIVPGEGRHTTVNYAMSNSLGFGGHNASVIFRKV